jgi:fumarylacetoacetase
MVATPDHELRSFVPVKADSHFPIQNLPYGVFRPRGGSESGRARIGVAIGEMILDVSVLEERGLLPVPSAAGRRLFAGETLNEFLSLGRTVWREARAEIVRLLSDDEATLRDNAHLRRQVLIPLAEAELRLPIAIGDYTDFYSSREHATNVGTMLRGPESALMPNWLHLPVAYHGRASSVVVSGNDLHRPLGQTKLEAAALPTFGPSRSMDFELEVGCVIGPGNRLGEPIPIDRAWEHVFGLVLVNDWSARDIQKWEYVPLGPFLSKNLGTSISPWIVPLEALEPFRMAGPTQDPEPLPYLRGDANFTYDIHLEVFLQTAASAEPHRICESNFRHLYWSIAQQVAHHTINGCNLRPGDLLASGTISGPTPDSRGSLLELSWGGTQPLNLPNGETRRFLEDGDHVTITGWCQGEGYRVGFGEVTGTLLPPA